MEALQRAIRLSLTMWGGRYNPIVPVDDLIAEALVKLFRVDALVTVSDVPAVRDFITAHIHLTWPMMGGGIFKPSVHGGKTPLIVDISHPTVRIYEHSFKNNPNPQSGFDLYEWDADDPLADVFLCSYGAFPSADEVGVGYLALVQRSLLGVRKPIQNGGEAQIPDPTRLTIARLNRADMQRHYAVRNHMDYPGFYVGEADNFDDLVNFWNLCAADIPLVFFDPRYANRLRGRTAHWVAIIRQAPPTQHGPQGLALWHRAERPIDDALQHFGEGGLTTHKVHGLTWNGGNVRAPIMCFGGGTALASIDQGEQRQCHSL